MTARQAEAPSPRQEPAAAQPSLDELVARAARVPALERSLERKQRACKELEQMLEDRTRELYLALEEVKGQTRALSQHAAARALAEAPTLEKGAAGMLEAYCTHLGWDVGGLWVVDSSANALHCLVTWQAATASADAFTTRSRESVFARGVELPGRVWATGAPAWIRDVVTDPDFTRADAAAASDLHGACAFPISIGTEIAGVVELLSREPQEIDADLLETLTAVGVQMGQYLQHRHNEDAVRQNELRIARRIQSSILPRNVTVAGLEVAAQMVPASEIGGDYYDVLPAERGAWIGVGDVAAHGLAAGVVMMMVQGVIASITAATPDAAPSQILRVANRILCDSVGARMQHEEPIGLSLFRTWSDGRVRVAGAHLDLVLCRAAGARCELVSTPGPRLGATPAAGDGLVDTDLQLEPGDVMVVYTDGVTQAMNAKNEPFGIKRLCAEIAAAQNVAMQALVQRVVQTVRFWTPAQQDDITVVALRRV